MTEAQGDFVIPDILLEPEFQHAEGVKARDIRDRQEIPHQILRGIAAAEPEPCGADGGSAPADGFFQIQLESEIQQSGINGPVFDTTCCVSPDLGRVTAKNFNAAILQRRARPEPVVCDAVGLGPIWNSGIVFKILGIGPCRQWCGKNSSEEEAFDGFFHDVCLFGLVFKRDRTGSRL